MSDDGYSRTSSWLTAAAGVLGALFLLLSTVLYITAGGGINDGILGGTVGVWSCICFVIAVPGICRILQPRAPRAAPIVGAIGAAGFVGGAVFNAQAMYLGKYDIDLIDDVTTGGGTGSDWISFFAFLPWGWMAPLSFVLIGWLVWRARAAATYIAALFALGGVLFVAGRPARIDSVAVVTDIVLLLAFLAITPSLLRPAGDESTTSNP